LYWMHAWDMITPVEEVVASLDTLVKAGKIRYIGFSDVPAWYAARAQTLAEQQGRERIAALQLEYSLVERNIEREHIPAALELGMAILPWGPTGGWPCPIPALREYARVRYYVPQESIRAATRQSVRGLVVPPESARAPHTTREHPRIRCSEFFLP